MSQTRHVSLSINCNKLDVSSPSNCRMSNNHCSSFWCQSEYRSEAGLASKRCRSTCGSYLKFTNVEKLDFQFFFTFIHSNASIQCFCLFSSVAKVSWFLYFGQTGSGFKILVDDQKWYLFENKRSLGALRSNFNTEDTGSGSGTY